MARGSNARSVGTQLQKAGLLADTTVFRFVVWKRGGLALKATSSSTSSPPGPAAEAWLDSIE